MDNLEGNHCYFEGWWSLIIMRSFLCKKESGFMRGIKVEFKK